MIISHRHEFIFVHVEKTAGDAITENLMPYLGWRDFVFQNRYEFAKRRILHGVDSRYRALSKHSTARQIVEHVGAEVWDSYFTFGFVREPIARTRSFYTFIQGKVEERGRRSPRNVWYRTPMGSAGDPEMWSAVQAFRETDSFSEFIRHPGALGEEGLQSQASILCDVTGEVMVDFVGRFEHLTRDFDAIRSAIGINSRSLARANSSPRSNVPWQISDDDRHYLIDYFAQDYTVFGY